MGTIAMVVTMLQKCPTPPIDIAGGSLQAMPTTGHHLPVVGVEIGTMEIAMRPENTVDVDLETIHQLNLSKTDSIKTGDIVLDQADRTTQLRWMRFRTA
jgi:hypothetical protein